MIKGGDKYPRTMAATLRFLQYHNLRGKSQSTPTLKKEYKGKGTNLSFASVNNKDEKRDQPEDDVVELNRVSKVCGQFRDGCVHLKRNTPGRSALETSGVLTSARSSIVKEISSSTS